MKATKGKGAVRKGKTEVPVEERKIGKRKAAEKAKQSSSKRVKKDPNKPKRPPTAFFVFLEEFRKVYKEEHPNVKAVSAVGKAGGAKWKTMSDAEKATYEAKAAKRKSEYEKLMTAYNKRQENSEEEEDDDAESEKSKSEVNGEDDGGSQEEEEEDEDDD